MTDYYKRKALQATEYKIERTRNQRGFFVRNFWKVVGFGIFVSIWAPGQGIYHHGFKRKSAIEVSDLSYVELSIITAVGYTIVCILGHFIWKHQDQKRLERLIKKKEQLERELGRNE